MGNILDLNYSKNENISENKINVENCLYTYAFFVLTGIKEHKGLNKFLI